MTRINFARRAPLAASAFFIGLCAATGAQAHSRFNRVSGRVGIGNGDDHVVDAGQHLATLARTNRQSHSHPAA